MTLSCKVSPVPTRCCHGDLGHLSIRSSFVHIGASIDALVDVSVTRDVMVRHAVAVSI